jgi:hypothetical protein
MLNGMKALLSSRSKPAILIGFLFASPLAGQTPDSSTAMHCRMTDVTPACYSWTLFDVSFLEWRGGTNTTTPNTMIGPTAAVALSLRGLGLVVRRSIVTNRHPDLTATCLGLSAGRGINPALAAAALTGVIVRGMRGP